jgi:hypothetical protein
MNPAVLATFAIAVAFCVAAMWQVAQGNTYPALMNFGLTLTNFAWAMIQRA